MVVMYKLSQVLSGPPKLENIHVITDKSYMRDMLRLHGLTRDFRPVELNDGMYDFSLYLP